MDNNFKQHRANFWEIQFDLPKINELINNKAVTM